MNIKEIFESDFAIGLAQEMADRQRNSPPPDTFSRLLLFGGIGISALIIGALSLLFNLSTLVSDPNTRTFLSFTSFVSALVLLATVGASLVFLWDAYIGEYIQKLALMDQQADQTERLDEEAPTDEGFAIPLTPISAQSPDLPVHMEPAIVDYGLSLKVEDHEFLTHDGVSTHILDRQLEELKAVVPADTWNQLHFEESLQFFQGLPQTATVDKVFAHSGQLVIAQVLPMLSDPFTVQQYNLAQPIAHMLSTLPQNIAADSEDDDPLEENIPAAM